MKKHGKARYIFISVVLSICLLGVSYSFWNESSGIAMFVSTGYIELTFNDSKSADSFDNSIHFSSEKTAVIQATIQREDYQPGSYIKLYVKNTGKAPVIIQDHINDIRIEPESIGEIKVPLAIDDILNQNPEADLGTEVKNSSKINYTLLSGKGWNDYLTIDQIITIIEPEKPLLAQEPIVNGLESSDDEITPDISNSVQNTAEPSNLDHEEENKNLDTDTTNANNKPEKNVDDRPINLPPLEEEHIEDNAGPEESSLEPSTSVETVPNEGADAGEPELNEGDSTGAEQEEGKDSNLNSEQESNTDDDPGLNYDSGLAESGADCADE